MLLPRSIGLSQTVLNDGQKFVVVHGLLKKSLSSGLQYTLPVCVRVAGGAAMMTGITERYAFALSLSMTTKPSPPGRPRSRIIKSGWCFRASEMLVSESVAKKVS